MRESIYDKTYSFGEDLKIKSFDYKDVIMKKTLSNHLFKNEKIASFLTYINDIFYTYIEMVKYIRIYDNYTVKKNYKKIS
jgi:hypothetical protein